MSFLCRARCPTRIWGQLFLRELWTGRYGTGEKNCLDVGKVCIFCPCRGSGHMRNGLVFRQMLLLRFYIRIFIYVYVYIGNAAGSMQGVLLVNQNIREITRPKEIHLSRSRSKIFYKP